MIGRETRVLLRHYLEQEMSKAAVARRLRISRRTVHRWIASGQLDRELDEERVKYGPRHSQPTKLDPYKGIIKVRLGEYPELSGARLFEEVRAAGYAGGYDQVRRYVRKIRPRPVEEPVQRFETDPRHQAQVDFAQFQLPWGRRHALIVVLGYSRLMWLQYYERQTVTVLMRGLESTLHFFQGVSSELLFGQMKAVIIEDGREQGGRLVLIVPLPQHPEIGAPGLLPLTPKHLKVMPQGVELLLIVSPLESAISASIGIGLIAFATGTGFNPFEPLDDQEAVCSVAAITSGGSTSPSTRAIPGTIRPIVYTSPAISTGTIGGGTTTPAAGAAGGAEGTCAPSSPARSTSPRIVAAPAAGSTPEGAPFECILTLDIKCS